ncbi:MAG: hypothetical protein QM784_31000 [Polyangiaceae bacterium]
MRYERWLSEQAATASPSSYLFFEPRLRFFPEADDILVAIPEVRLERSHSTVVLVHRSTRSRVNLDGLAPEVAERIWSHIDGKASVFGVQRRAQVTAAQMDRFLALTFGTIVLAPFTIERLSNRLPAASIVRFPGSPYEIDRAYWANQIDVRAAIDREFSSEMSTTAFVDWLAQLHVLSLMGESRRSYYRPSSPIVAKAGARAGALYDVATRTQQDAGMTLLLDGPRVSAPHVGGSRYHELLSHSLNDPGALQPARELKDVGVLPWGRVVHGMARTDPEPLPWFVPPRPLKWAHFERLSEAWRTCATQSTVSTAARELGTFHWLFVRLHPFACANQSVGMNLVNSVLARLDHCPIPHLVLDQLALRYEQSAYEGLFERAIHAWSEPANGSAEGTGQRAMRLLGRRQAMDRLLSQLTESRTIAECEDLVASDGEGRSALLLTPVDGSFVRALP